MKMLFYNRALILIAALAVVSGLTVKSNTLSELKVVGDSVPDKLKKDDIAATEKPEKAELKDVEDKKKNKEDLAEESKSKNDAEHVPEDNEDEDPDPKGKKEVVELDEVDWTSKLKNFFRQKKKYAYITMFLNETLVNRSLSKSGSKSSKVMSYEQSKAEALARWVKQMTAGGISTKHPPTELFANILNPNDKKHRNSKHHRYHKTSGIKDILHIADSLRRVNSSYPLVVVSNDMTILSIHKKHHPNLILVPWKKNFLQHSCHMYAMNTLHFQKLGIFNMTDYDKLMWLDTDLEIKKNFDDLFELDTKDGKHIYGQIDDYWMCKDHQKVLNNNKTAYGFCSGMMLFEPSYDHFQGLLKQQHKMANNTCWGDQSLIQAYFGTEKTSLYGEDGREIKLFGKKTVSFPYCARDDTAVIHHSDPQS